MSPCRALDWQTCLSTIASLTSVAPLRSPKISVFSAHTTFRLSPHRFQVKSYQFDQARSYRSTRHLRRILSNVTCWHRHLYRQNGCASVNTSIICRKMREAALCSSEWVTLACANRRLTRTSFSRPSNQTNLAKIYNLPRKSPESRFLAQENKLMRNQVKYAPFTNNLVRKSGARRR